MPRGGKNHAGGGESIRGGEIFALASRAQDSIFLPPPWPILVVRPWPFSLSLLGSMLAK